LLFIIPITSSVELENSYVPGELIVKFKDDSSRKSALSSVGSLNNKFEITSMVVLHEGLAPDIFKLNFNENENMEKIADKYSELDNIEYAEPNYIYTIDIAPNDPSLATQSYLTKVNAENAWNTTIGNTSIIIAVIDTGVDYNHTDLEANIYNNTVEIIDGTDTDGNTYVDDFRGWDFTDIDVDTYFAAGYLFDSGEDYNITDNDPMDFHGHGTHVSGIAAGVGNNSIGISGVCWNCKILPIRAGFKINHPTLGWVGTLENDDIALAIRYAANQSADVISMSFGGSYSDAINDSVDYAYNKDVILVASAGNSDSNAKSYPAALEKVISIGASDTSDIKASFSNYGDWVSLAAPGTSIYSTYFDDTYATNQGTSMSAPLVSGAIGLLLSYNSSFSQSYVLNLLNDTGVKISNFGGSSLSRIDLNTTFDSFDDVILPIVEINLTSLILEFDQDNLTINTIFTDDNLDSSLSNVSYPNGSLFTDFSDNLNLTTNNLTFLGTYKVYAWANDTNGNENFTSKSFLVRDIGGLNVNSFTFHEVDNNNYSGTNYIEFNVTINSKYNLDNATLSHNFTDWNENETFVLDTNETNPLFNGTFDDGIYLWNVETCDVNNHCANSGNKTLFVDLTNPSITLDSPVNNTNFSSLANINFKFNVSDFAISSCTLHFNKTVNETLNSVSVSGVNEFAETFYYIPNGNYTWKTECIDNVDRSSNSSEFNFNVDCVSESTFSRDCGSWSSCMENKKTKLCYDSNYCTSIAQNISATFNSCSSNDDSSSGGGINSGGSSGSGGSVSTSTDSSNFKFSAGVGDKKKISISKDVGISGLDIDFKKAVTNVDIKVTKQDSKPSSTSAIDNVYKYIQIATNLLDEDLEQVKIEFKVEQSWININALGNVNNVFLNRYVDGKWIKLETLTAGIDGTKQKYIAYSPGFSYFAISANRNVVVDTAKVLTNFGNEVDSDDTVNVTVDEIIENNETETSNFFLFTGKFYSDTFGGDNSIYSLISLGVFVLILTLFLFLRFKKKISRTKGINFNKGKYGKFKWLLGLGLLRILKRSNGKIIGTWEQSSEEKKETQKIKHDFKIKTLDIEKQPKKSFFRKLFSKKNKSNHTKLKSNEKIEKSKKSFLKKLKNRFKRRKKDNHDFELSV
jgi:PGF-pre-PGF domain-containing protein